MLTTNGLCLLETVPPRPTHGLMRDLKVLWAKSNILESFLFSIEDRSLLEVTPFKIVPPILMGDG